MPDPMTDKQKLAIVAELEQEVRDAQTYSSAIFDCRNDARWKAATLIEKLVKVLDEIASGRSGDPQLIALNALNALTKAAQ